MLPSTKHMNIIFLENSHTKRATFLQNSQPNELQWFKHNIIVTVIYNIMKYYVVPKRHLKNNHSYFHFQLGKQSFSFPTWFEPNGFFLCLWKTSLNIFFDMDSKCLHFSFFTLGFKGEERNLKKSVNLMQKIVKKFPRT